MSPPYDVTVSAARFIHCASAVGWIAVMALAAPVGAQARVAPQDGLSNGRVSHTEPSRPQRGPLDNVIVTGTVVPTALKAVPSAMTVITAKELEERGITQIQQLFRGDVPGLFALRQGVNSSFDEVVMYSRGAAALTRLSAGTSTDPNDGTAFLTSPIKTYVDGIELSNPKYLSLIDTKSIERIEIITGPQASTIYGSNALNGVMQVFTKRGGPAGRQLTFNLSSGWIENRHSNARAPKHDASGELSGRKSGLSYRVNGSWIYRGPWSPARQTVEIKMSGAVRLDTPTRVGRVTGDVAISRYTTQNNQKGNVSQRITGFAEDGWFATNNLAFGVATPRVSDLDGQLNSLQGSYAPTSWWSHQLAVGYDLVDVDERRTAVAYTTVGDSNLLFRQLRNVRNTLSYATTATASITSAGYLTVTAGGNASRELLADYVVMARPLAGSIPILIDAERQPTHNAGAFLQTQLGVWDKLFFTYGLRAEWNPNFGDEQRPNHAPRYGVSYVHELGALTAKFRGSYGRSTRPPPANLEQAITDVQAGYDPVNADYDLYDFVVGNPALGPESKQGGEGGVELYFGSRSSFVITRYNETVDDLIANLLVDSVRSNIQNPAYYDVKHDNYGYRLQRQYVNIASIRNQGWALQGTINTGPLSVNGTYSWTKSRTIGISSSYRAQFPQSVPGFAQYQPGAAFQYLPEHTWAVGGAYARSRTRVGFNVTGMGVFTTGSASNELYWRTLNSSVRLLVDRANTNTNVRYINVNKGYALASMNASHTFSRSLDGFVHVDNLTDHYANDFNARYPTAGREVKTGVRIRL
jgi:outer membrane cobalamin receptor